jgi:internalin A
MSDEREVFKRIRRANSEEATELKLSGMGLFEVPDSVFELHQLRAIDLRGNNLSSVPYRIKELTDLIMLDLRGNPLKSLPDQPGLIVDWSTLIRCKDSAVAGQVAGIRFDSDSDSLPEEILSLPSLELLDLGGQGRSSLPDGVADLSCLRHLDLSSNLFTSIPNEVYDLRSLRTLDISDNPISEISVDLLRLEELEWIGATADGIDNPPSEIVAHGMDAIREYLRLTSAREVTRLAEAKLLIIGEGGAGKTTLAHKLAGPSREMRDLELFTSGIEVREWLVPLNDQRHGNDPEGSGSIDHVRLNIWDFGGQEIFHGTHQLFMSKRAVYVLVVDSRAENPSFDYWLSIQELFGGNSPVLIVLNEKMDRRRGFDTGPLLDRFPNVKGIYRTNLATGRGLEEVRKSIQHCVNRLAFVSTFVPATWRRVREALLQIREAYISLAQYETICAKEGLLLPEEPLYLSQFLNDIGSLLHIQDDHLLRGIVFIDPSWVIHGLYMLLNDHEMHQTGGRFDSGTVKRIWGSEEYAPLVDVFLQLLVRFDLVYRLPGGRGYICPKFLPVESPEYEWAATEEIVLRYVYDFLPRSVFPRILVSLFDLLSAESILWKEGIMLQHRGSRALIRYNGENEIVVRVAGRDRREFIGVINHKLKKIHETFQRLKVQKLIPCNCRTCRSASEPHYFPYDALSRLHKIHKNEIQCHQSFEMVDVRDLLIGFPKSVVPLGSDRERDDL